ncbi:hypothetical protein HPB47_026607 [Ixodes persulcatus]|uniref:Uncharacterized protein n=1 Tax=Ixodes persulcatus TaxID=34615 RepID=A0AC60PY91_IXOPE|nr:hypothetical protein HPB47_026607 [Ixodes persulcatus]
MQTDFSDLLTLATAADAFAWSPLQPFQREAPFDAPLEPSVVPTPLRTGAIAPGSFLSAAAPPPAQSKAYRSPHGETAAAPHHTLLENAARRTETKWPFYRSTSRTYEEDLQPLLRAVRELLSPGYGSSAAFVDHGCAQGLPAHHLRDHRRGRKDRRPGTSCSRSSRDKSLCLWDLRSPNCQGVTHLTGRPVGNFDPESLIFAVGLNSELVKLYDLRAFDKGPFNTPDGKSILTSTNGAVIHLIDAFQGMPQQSLTGHTNNKWVPLEASFSPDSQFVFSGSTDGRVHVWSTAEGVGGFAYGGAQLRPHGPRPLCPVQPQVHDARGGLLDDPGDNVAPDTFVHHHKEETNRSTSSGTTCDTGLVSLATPALDVVCVPGEVSTVLELRQREVGRQALGCHGMVANEAVKGDPSRSSFETREATKSGLMSGIRLLESGREVDAFLGYHMQSPLSDSSGSEDLNRNFRGKEYNATTSPHVRTGSGLLVGVRSTVSGKDVDAFLGIPYAVPPVGNLRFRKPLPAPAWDGTYSATSKPTPCWQLDLRLTEDVFLNYSSASEDCLYLNVWRPAAPCRNSESCGPKLPVFVFIYGGGFQWGDSALFLHDGSNFASMSDVVFVSFNYRVGIFGFLSAESPELPGNMGLWDQNLALKWVQKNIEHFGGNPADVTVAGHSAGGISAGMHAVSPHSKGLMKRIIMQSGTPLAMVTIGAYKAGGQFINVASALGCYDRWKGFDEQLSDAMACLRELSASKIHETLKQESTFRQLFPPVTGDEFFPDDPLDAATWKKMSVKELIMGTTSNESTVFFQNIRLVAPQLSNLLSSNYRLTITIALKTMFNFPLGAGRDIVNAYFGDEEVHHDKDHVISMFCELLGDAMFYCPTHFFADVASRQGADVYRYVFAHKPSKSYFPAWMGVVHGADLGYMLGSLPFLHDESKLTPPVGPRIREILMDQTYTVEEEDFMKQVVSSWASFVRTGHVHPCVVVLAWTRERIYHNVWGVPHSVKLRHRKSGRTTLFSRRHIADPAKGSPSLLGQASGVDIALIPQMAASSLKTKGTGSVPISCRTSSTTGLFFTLSAAPTTTDLSVNYLVRLHVLPLHLARSTYQQQPRHSLEPNYYCSEIAPSPTLLQATTLGPTPPNEPLRHKQINYVFR